MDLLDKFPASDEQKMFKVTFECASTIRTLCDVMDNMLDTVDIQVINKPDFKGILVEAIDCTQVSLVIAQLRADVDMPEGQTSFCVNTKTLNTCIKSAQPHFSICLETMEQSSSIRLTAFEQLSKTSITRFVMPTLVCDQEPIRLKDQEYKYHVDIETSTLKSIVRMCLALRGETLTFKVKQTSKDVEAKKARLPNTKKDTVLTISSNGDCEQEHTFYTLSEECEDNSMAASCVKEIQSVQDEAGMQTMCENQYGAKQMQDFLKSIDKATVTLRLGQSQPLIINHKFGNESYVCLVVAPKEIV